MKKLMMIAVAASMVMSCNLQTKKEIALQQKLDSLHMADSLERMAAAQKVNEERIARNSYTTAAASSRTGYTDRSVMGTSTTVNNKKKWSNKKKGVVIGASTGIITGAVVGKKPVRGAIIGGAIGAGVGLGAGAIMDKKENN